jgi:hypothetical protein
MRASLRAAAISLLVLALVPADSVEPLAGRWLLVSQEVGGQKTDPDPLTLRITQSGNELQFAYSVPVNNIQFVSLTFSPRLDGTVADVKDSHGNKIGTVRVTKAGPSLYKVRLEGPNRPTASGTMTVSSDGKTLNSQSDSSPPGQTAVTHTVQVFTRQ